MRNWLNNLWQQCLITADEATTRSVRALGTSSQPAGPAGPLQLDGLEPRILFSATPIDPAMMEGGDEAAMVATVDLEESADSSEFSSESTTTLVEAQPREIVIIDGSVDDIDQLLDDLNASDRNVEVFVLDSQRDGIDQITEILDGRTDIDSLHIVSHGDAGSVTLGNVTLSDQNLDGYAGQIATWQGSLTTDADLLFYGCDLASDPSGQHLVESLSVLTGADVAASDDITGHESLGGDWEFEFHVGSLETDIAFSAHLQQTWFSTLDVATFQQGVSGYSSTVDTEIDSGDVTADNSGSGTLDADDGPQKQILIRFEDLAGAGLGQIPAGATINSATLTINVTEKTDFGKIDIHEMLVGWNDTDGWSDLGSGVELDDVEAVSDREARLSNADQTGSQTFDLSVSTLQNWVDGLPNYGWVIVNNDPDGWSMDSSEGGVTPILTVDYTAPALDTTVRVNSTTVENQVTAETGGNSVARAANGDSVVVWSSDKQDGDRFGVFAQRYDSTGARVGTEIYVNDYTDRDQKNPSVAMDDAGNFVVVWQGDDDQDGDRFGIFAQRFDSAGNKVGGEIPVNTYTDFDQTNPAIAMDADGDFVITWQSFDQDGDDNGIYAQRFNSSGATVGDEFLVNTYTSFEQLDPSIAMKSSGEFVIAWASEDTPGGDSSDIVAQRYDAGGNKIGLEFLVNTYVTNDQTDSSIAIDDAGNFVIVWTSVGQDGDALGVYGRSYNSDGTTRSDEFLIPTDVTKEQEHAQVSMQGDGDFVVSWTHRDTENIYLRHFNIDGIAHGDTVIVDTTTDAQKYSGIAIDDNGGMTIGWSGDDPSGDEKGVFAQFTGPITNVKPVVTMPGPAVNYAESDPPTILDSGATVTDVDSANFGGGSLVVEFTLGGTANDRLEINHEGFGSGEIGLFGSVVRYENVDIGTFSGGTGGSTPLVIEFTSTAATPAAVEALARNITYLNVSDGPATDARQVRMYVHDGDGAASLVARKNINVTIVNDTPVITAPTTENISEGDSITFDVGTNEISVNDPDINLDEFQVTLTVTDGLMKLGATNNLTFTVGDGNDNPVMVFTGTQADVNNALDGLIVTPPQWFVGTTQLTVEISDQGSTGAGGEQVDTHIVNINVAADGTNDQPKIVKPGGQNTIEDQPLYFSAGNANQIHFEDDAGPLDVKVTLEVTSGTLTLSETTGLIFNDGTNNGESKLVVTGTVADINRAVDGMYFAPVIGFTGTVTLDIDIDDLGNSGGTPKLDSDSLDINVLVRNRAPDIAAPTSVTTIENTNFTFDGVNLISFSDIDAGGADLEVTVSITHGELTLGDPGVVSYTVGDGINDATMTFKGSLSELNSAIDSMVFTPQTGYAGSTTMQISVNDLGNSGAGGALTDQEIVTVFEITPDGTDDSPVNTVPGPQSTPEETPLTFSDGNSNQISINDDTGPGTVTVTLTATDGKISLSNTSGSEFQVNTDISGDQDDPQVAMAPNGSYIIVWTSAGQDGSGDGVYAQRYDDSGSPLGGEIRINENIPGDQNEPSIATDDSGNFVVVWTSNNQDGSSKGVYGRQFSADGTPVAGEFLVNVTTANEQRSASVAVDADGDFVVVWQSKAQDSADNWGVYGTRFDSAGNALDVFGGPAGVKEFLVNTETTSDQLAPVVAMDDAGNFAIAWASKNQDSDDFGVYAKRYSTAGEALDYPPTPGQSEFRVNTVFFKDQSAPSIAMDDDGDFVIAWQSEKQDHTSGDKDAQGVFAQRFDGGGNQVGTNFLVNSTVVNNQSAPTVSMDGDGNFVVGWQAKKQDNLDGKFGVYGQRYDLSGTALGSEFLINSHTLKEQLAPALAMGDDGRFVATWQSKGQDQGDSWGVYGQLYKDTRALVFNTGDGFDDPEIEIEGTVDQINDAMNGLVFTPDPDFVGTATLQIVTDDGNTTPDDDTINITVGAVNDAPTVTAPATESVLEGDTLEFSLTGGNQILIGDVDIAGSEPVEVTLLATQGTITLGGTFGLSFTDGDGTNDTAMTFTGTLTDINNALDGMDFNAPPTYAGDAILQINVNDLGNVGSEPALSAGAAVLISVTSDPINDVPIIGLPDPQRTPVDTPVTLSEANGNLVSITDDSGNNSIEVTLTVTNGTLTLSQQVASEFQINTYSTSDQQLPAVAATPVGDYVVVWQSDVQDGAGLGVFAQRFNSAGQPMGAEFQVNNTSAGNQKLPVVTINASGQFAVAWQSAAQDGSGDGVYARVFDAFGLPVGDEFLVNSNTENNQTNPSIAMDDAGNFVVAWESADQDGNGLGVFAQQFDTEGVANGPEFQVNTVVTGNQRNAAVAMDADGDFVVVWQGRDVSGEGILAQRYDADGNTVGDEFLVATVTLNNQTVPEVAMDDAGNFMVVWQSAGEDGSGESVVGRLYDNAGVPQGANIRITTTTAGDQKSPSVAMSGSGEFFVSWQDADDDGQGAFGQRFDATGNKVGEEIQINSQTNGNQTGASVSMDDQGNVIAVWTDEDGTDGDGDGIFGQRLSDVGALTFTTGDGENDATMVFTGTLTDINNALANMTFTPTSLFTGLATVQIDVDDLGSNGFGGPLTASDKVDIMVGGGTLIDLDADDSEGQTGSGIAVEYVPLGGPIAVVDPFDATIDDPLTTDLTELTVTITNKQAGDLLTANNAPNPAITVNYNATTGILTLSSAGPEAMADYEAILRTVNYDNSLPTPDATTRVIEIKTSDGINDSNTAVALVTYPGSPIDSVSDTDVAIDQVAENATIGTAVGITAVADDPDVADVVTYSLDDDAGGLFAINATTGVVTVNGALDAEAATSHNIAVRATSTDTTFSTQGFTIAVNDVDEFDIGGISDTDGAANTVGENAAIGATVGVTAFANDPDVTDIVSYTLDDNAGGLFAINSATGVVTVNGALDAETSTSHNITVRATSTDTSFSTQGFTIAVTDVNEFDVGSVGDNDATANSVAENATVGATVGLTAFADDSDLTDTVSYSLDDDAGGRFTIHATTGVVTVNGALDAETATSHNITVRATSTDTSFTTRVFVIGVTDINESAISTISDTDLAADSVAESAGIGAVVGITAFADDLDVSDNVSYSLDDDAGGLFTIHTTTGVVTVNGALDAETAASHNITVRATSDDTSFDTKVFNITVTDVNEVSIGSISDTDAGVEAVAENAAVGATVGITALADDADVTHTVSYSLDDDAGGLFTIHATTGVVTVNAALDAETATSHNITVRATSTDTTFSTAGFTINVTDVDEVDITAISDTDATVDSVAENSTIGTTVGVTAFADDLDVDDDVAYSLDVDAGGLFTINATTGVVTVNGALDYESTTSHLITVRATSDDTSSSTRNFTINVNDVDEFNISTISDTDAAGEAVAENAVIGAAVGVTAFADDADASDNVAYSLDADAGGLFTINSATGVVTVNAALDAEIATSHNITVRATSDDTSFSTRNFTIAVTDVDESDISEISDTDAATDEVSEDAANGTVVGVTAFADDTDVDDDVTYSLDDDAGGRFAINSTTGVVTVADTSLIDFETLNLHNITVRATSDDGSFSTLVFGIDILDAPDNGAGPISDADGAADTVAENAVIGATVGITAFSTDPDLLENITYSLDDDASGRFLIDGTTGIVTVNAALDAETATSHNITVRATSDDTSFTTRVFAIAVTDINEVGIGPIVDNDAGGETVAENASFGTTVGITAFAEDLDVDDDVIYSLDDSAGGRFAINASTGVVTVSGALDAESSASHNIIVRATSDDTTFSTQGFVISVSDIDEFDASPISDTDASLDSVAENATIGATVGITALSTDADLLDGITYSLDVDAGGLFTINSASGIVTVNGVLDAETSTSHNITVRAASDDGSFTTRIFAIAVTDIDEAGIGPISDSDAAADTVAENATVGTAVRITALADDPDVTDNVTYSLDDNAGGLFAINGATGVVTVNGGLDAETAPSHNITVRATSDDTTFSTKNYTISVTDFDEFNVSGISDTDAAVDTVLETATVGTTVGVTALAVDADLTDNVTYTLDNDAGGRFVIHGVTGVVTVNGALDYESFISHNIVVRATSDDTSFSTQGFTIAVGDVNESGVGPISDADVIADSVAETASVGTSVGISALATDPDTSDIVTYSLDDSAGGLFAINATTGAVTVNGALDAESATSHNIIVRATSDDTSATTLGFVISVADVDEYNVGPISDTDAAANSVSESAIIGASVGVTAFATDADIGDSVSYSLDDDASGRFVIHATTGVVTLNAGLDYESNTSHNITVRATSDDTSFSTRVFAIAVGDVNDNAPVIAPNQVLAVNENVPNGTPVGPVIATDVDTAGTLGNWSITGGNADGIFAINTLTGALSVVDNTKLDFETTNSYLLSVQMDDGINPSVIETVTVNINDTNDAPVIDDQAFGLDENSPNGTSVGTVLGSDEDTGQTLSYAIIGGTGQTAFSINPVTAELIVADSTKLNFEGTPVLTLTVRVTDDGTPSLSDTATITINLNDVNDAPVAVANSYTLFRGDTLNIPASGLLANDVDEDGDSLTAILVSGAGGGTVTVFGDGSFQYVSNNVFFGVDSFTYKTNDGTVDGNTITVTLNVLVASTPPTPPTPDPTPDPDPDPVPAPDPDPDPAPDPDPDPVTPLTDGPSASSTPKAVSAGTVEVFLPEMTEEFVTSVFSDYGVAAHGTSGLQGTDDGDDKESDRGRIDKHFEDSHNGTLSRLDFLLMTQSGELWDEMDLHRNEVDSRIQGDIIVVGAAGAAASTFTVGYVAWALRSGFILSGLLAQMPAWQSIDPLMIMQGLSGSRKDETLEEMMERKAKGIKETADGAG